MSRRHTIDDFIRMARAVHGDRYDYSKAVYVSALQKVEIVCKIHGSFYQKPNKHVSCGHNCPQCMIDKSTKDRTKAFATFLKQAQEVHGNRYEYVESTYVDAHTRMDAVCSDHGVFRCLPMTILSRGSGCPACGIIERAKKKTKDKEDFLRRARETHGDRYDYSYVDYVNISTKISIVCSMHGIFKQAPSAHVGGHGCPKCTHIISKAEIQWLKKLGVEPKDQEFIRAGNRRYKPDAFDEAANCVYEFLGDFYHGNPRSRFRHDSVNTRTKTTFGELYEKTKEKINNYRQAGFNVIYVWESDFEDGKLRSDDL